MTNLKAVYSIDQRYKHKEAIKVPFKGFRNNSTEKFMLLLVMNHSINIQCLKWEEVRDNNMFFLAI